MTAGQLASLSSPETLGTPFGTMEFFDGVPVPGTVEISYDIDQTWQPGEIEPA